MSIKELFVDQWTWFHRKLTNIWIYFVMLVLFTSVVIAVVFWKAPNNLFTDFVCYYLGINPITNDSQLKGHEFPIIMIAIFGFFTFNGLLIAAFSSGVERYVERIREGRKRFFFLSNHYIMIGYNHYSPTIIEQILTNDPKAKLVILTSEDVKKVRKNLQASLSSNIEKRIIIYAGDGNANKHISALNLHKAIGVYIMVEEIEWKNQYTQGVMLLKSVAQYAGPRSITKGSLLPVNLFINEPSSYDLVQKLSIPPKYVSSKQTGESVRIQNIDLHVSNYYENWARLLWSYMGKKKENGDYVYDALDFEPIEGTDKYVHLVIVGYNNMGHALLMEALRICHYPNYDEETGRNRSVITIIDSQSDKYEEQLYAQYPLLKEQIKDVRIDFMALPLEDRNVRKQLKEWSYDKNQMLTIAICVSDPDKALTMALTLPEELYFHYEELELISKDSASPGDKQIIKENPTRTRILVCQKAKEALTDLFEGRKDSYKQIRLFGFYINGFDTELLKDELAICINGIYSDYQKSLNKTNGVKDIDTTVLYSKYQDWKENWLDRTKTSEMDKLATRYQVDYYRTLLGIIQRNDTYKTNPLLLNQLAHAEHRRWIAERTLAGWRQIKDEEKRVDELKIHKCIISHTQLPEIELTKDTNVVEFAPVLHEFVGKITNKSVHD
ncbi:MAG: hypothetical protein IJV44_10905 [Prevotella sp.]|nr:hypothetical protein [Prevotella sp.]